MGLTLKAFDAEAVWHEPDLWGNRDLDEPMAIEILPATRQDIQRVDEQNMRITKGSINPARRIAKAMNMLVEKYAGRVRGLAVELDDGSKVEITTSVELVANPYIPEALIVDIVGVIRNKSELEDDARKNSD